MNLSEINQTTVTLSDKSKAVGELHIEQRKLFSESQEIFKQILALGKKYQIDLKELTDRQAEIAEKTAAIDVTLHQLLK